MQSYSQEDIKKGSWLSKLLRRKQPPRMSVIGPADLLRTIHKDGNMIQAVVLTQENIGGGNSKSRPPPPKSHTSAQSTDNKKEEEKPQENEGD